MNNVIQLAAFRKQMITAAQKRTTSRLHIDIMNDGSINFEPMELAQPQALAMLRMVIAVADHCLARHDGRRSRDDS